MTDLPFWIARSSPFELALFEEHKEFMHSLAAGRAPPRTEAQEHFLAVSNGLKEPSTDFEFAWLRVTRAEEVLARLSDKLNMLNSQLRMSAKREESLERKADSLLARLSGEHVLSTREVDVIVNALLRGDKAASTALAQDLVERIRTKKQEIAIPTNTPDHVPYWPPPNEQL